MRSAGDIVDADIIAARGLSCSDSGSSSPQHMWGLPFRSATRTSRRRMAASWGEGAV